MWAPLVYRGNAGFRDEMLTFATEFADRDLIARHYLHLGERQRHTYFGDGKDVALKKIFYALRPAATLRWLRLRPGEAIAPMHFPTLMASCEPPADVVGVVEDLMARKAQTRELGSAPLPERIRAFMDAEFDLARIAFEKGPVRPSADAVAAAEALCRRHAWYRDA
ncbi:MAG: nucleotidyltransferase domain-containing protein [Sphingomonas bacterium]